MARTSRVWFRTRRARWLAAGAVTVFLGTVVAAVVAIHFNYEPHDRVVVTVGNAEPSAKIICLLVETPDGPDALLYYQDAASYGRYREHPNVYGPWTRSYHFPKQGMQSAVPIPVAWRDAERYGVLTWHGGDDWRLWWFDREAVPVEGRSLLLGGGEAVIDLPDGVGVQPSDELLDQCGFGPDVRSEWQAYPDTFPPGWPRRR